MMVERLQARHGKTGPLTLFLVENDAEHAVGTHDPQWACEVIAFNSKQGEPPQPTRDPYQILRGTE
jgi:hypothetical protein